MPPVDTGARAKGSAAARWTRETLEPALATIHTDLPANLDRVARQAGQSLSVQDPGRQIEAIETALRLLSGILSVSSSR